MSHMHVPHHRHIPKTVKEVQKEYERQQPIIAELVTRFEKLQNKRESYKAAAQRPNMLPPPSATLRSTASTLPRKPQKASDAGLMIDIMDIPPPPPPLEEANPIKRKKTRPVLTMESALGDARLRGHFREFIEAAYAVENLDFFEAVEKFETLASDKDRLESAKKILDQYVRDTADNQVNLPSSLATKLGKAVDAGAKDDIAKLLGQAKGEILDLMQMNFFDKFLSVVGQPAYVPDEESDSDDDVKSVSSIMTFKTTTTGGGAVVKPVQAATLKATLKKEDSEEKKKYFKNWVQRRHPKTGAVYYENPETGVTMWEMPKPIEPPPYF